MNDSKAFRGDNTQETCRNHAEFFGCFYDYFRFHMCTALFGLVWCSKQYYQFARTRRRPTSMQRSGYPKLWAPSKRQKCTMALPHD